MGCNAWMDVAITFDKGERDDELLAWAKEHRFTLMKMKDEDGSTFTVAGDGEASWFGREVGWLKEELSTIPVPTSEWKAEVTYQFYDGEPDDVGNVTEFGIEGGKVAWCRESRVIMADVEPWFEFDMTKEDACC